MSDYHQWMSRVDKLSRRDLVVEAFTWGDVIMEATWYSLAVQDAEKRLKHLESLINSKEA
tara:strand:+ start:965 stop:1144 length:180 start_codon:yes stop_codon:yes gene_type:complete